MPKKTMPKMPKRDFTQSYALMPHAANGDRQGKPYLLMDVQSASTAPGAPVIIWTTHSLVSTAPDNQDWWFGRSINPGDDSYAIVNNNSQLPIEVPGSSLADNVQVTQAAPGQGGDNACWYLTDPHTGQHMSPVLGGSYNIVNKHSGKALGLDISDEKGFHDGDRVVQAGTPTVWTLLD